MLQRVSPPPEGRDARPSIKIARRVRVPYLQSFCRSSSLQCRASKFFSFLKSVLPVPSVLGNVDGAGRNPWGVAPRLHPSPRWATSTHFTPKGNSYEETESNGGLRHDAVPVGSNRHVRFQPSRSAHFGARS